jgi:hypothetical protein
MKRPVVDRSLQVGESCVHYSKDDVDVFILDSVLPRLLPEMVRCTDRIELIGFQCGHLASNATVAVHRVVGWLVEEQGSGKDRNLCGFEHFGDLDT